MVKILLVNNEGSGFAGHKEVAEGTTAGELFRSEMGDRNPSNYLMNVNREQVSTSYVLQNGDRVSMTPTKIEGA